MGNSYYNLPTRLEDNSDDAVTTNVTDYMPGGRAAFDPDRRIADIPNHEVEIERDVHKAMARAMVVRSMTLSEVMANPEAVKAVNAEWQKLRTKKYIDPCTGKENREFGMSPL